MLILLVALFIGIFDLWSHPIWSSDGFIYSQMMLQDAGFSKESAKKEARDFYLRTAIGKNPRYHSFFIDDAAGMFSPEAKPFAARILYPYLASRLYPTYGFRSLIVVSIIAYVLAAVALYMLLALFCADWLAAAGAIATMAVPSMRALGASALTDMLAITFWVGIICMALVYLRSPRWIWLILFLVLCFGLALSRPAVYLPIGLACGAIIGSLRRARGANLGPATLLLSAAVAGAIAYALVARLTETPGIGTHLHWLYQRALTGWFYANPRVLSSADRHSFSVWYLRDVLWTSVFAFGRLIRAILPAVFLLVALIGFYKERERLEIAALVGACIFGVLGIFANPVLAEVPRLVEVPLYPIFAVGVILVVNGLMARYKTQRSTRRTT